MKESAPVIILLRLTTDGHKTSRGLSATAELLVIILSLLQTEINYDQAYPQNIPPNLKSSSALPCKMNKNVLANVAGMIS